MKELFKFTIFPETDTENHYQHKQNQVSICLPLHCEKSPERFSSNLKHVFEKLTAMWEEVKKKKKVGGRPEQLKEKMDIL